MFWCRAKSRQSSWASATSPTFRRIVRSPRRVGRPRPWSPNSNTTAWFIGMCDDFNLRLLLLADVHELMVGTQGERKRIIRHKHKMLTAVANATVANLYLFVPKTNRQGLYPMAWPVYAPDGTL